MLKDKRHVFWQALVVTVFIFALGVVLGVFFEQTRSDKINVMFHDSEVSLYDSFALSEGLGMFNVSCEVAESFLIDFADKVYEESKLLAEYEKSAKISNSLKSLYRKYDVLRTILWVNTIKVKERCDINTVVYLYQRDTEEIETSARQSAISRTLGELKRQEGNTFILIPIAVDQDIASLDYMLEGYKIDSFPIVVINEKHLITEIISISDFERYLNG